MKKLFSNCREKGLNASVVFGAMLVLLMTVFNGNGQARIPEPDNILYGLMPAANTTITLKANGAEITSYTMGDNPNAGEYFVLRVPMDAMDPPVSGSMRTGDAGELFLDEEAEPVATVQIGLKGTVQRIYLPGTDIPENDADGDGVPDETDNCPDIPNPDQYDSNNNGIGDACDDADTDGDGYSDMLEHAYYLEGRLDPDGNPYNPNGPNAPGDAGYNDPGASSFWLLILPAILNNSQAR
ncbi:MAG: thrombospondin type 3 repeat-containing protein [Desulfobulbaceae bacterium]|nr:thrombospondin type 3 repeat-containing protein [Desulfobulbaceae bacterium]